MSNALLQRCRFVCILIAAAAVGRADPPTSFDLRDVNGENYVTPVKSQQGGTCWTHGIMAANEGNLMMTGNWAAAGEDGLPDLAEYHLDWWNGFNQHNNDDTEPNYGGGLEVHYGGDYRVGAAYQTRGEGAVRDIDGQSFETPPARWAPSYHIYYARHIEWFVAGQDLSNIDTIKNKIMSEGVMGTCMCYDGAFMSGNYTHYQPPSSSLLPNHAIAIVGWDDNKSTQAPQPGAWLCKNSWGSGWGLDGFFWISYYDKWCCQEPEMGAVSFQGVELLPYDEIYYHDYHGWRDTLTNVSEAFNAFVATSSQLLHSVSFFVAVDNVTYTVRVYDRFEGGELLDELAMHTGTIEYTGFHTVDLDTPAVLTEGDDFYIYLELSAGGQPYDRTSEVPVLLGARYRTIVESSASAGESYYRNGGEWLDLYDYEFTDSSWNGTANFCIKGLGVEYPPLYITFPEGLPDYVDPGEATPIAVEISDAAQGYVPDSGLLHYRYDGGSFLTAPLTMVTGTLYATLPPAECGDQPEFYISAEGDGGSTVLSPPDAPDSLYTAAVGEPVLVFADNFETDQGWTAENLGATSGFWQRGVPVNDPDWDYDPMSDADGSGQCYLTQNQYGNTDVDDGAVRLTSPTIDMTGGDITISYDYYLLLTNTAGGVDRLLVEISSNDGGGPWIEIARHDTNGGLNWRHHAITQADLDAAGVTLTATMKIRFTTNDADPQSINESGLDAFEVVQLHCEGGAECFGDLDGDDDVDLNDLATLLSHYGMASGAVYEDGDLDEDGDVDLTDLASLLSVYGTTCG
jgi:C1A family cysteine protease